MAKPKKSKQTNRKRKTAGKHSAPVGLLRADGAIVNLFSELGSLNEDTEKKSRYRPHIVVKFHDHVELPYSAEVGQSPELEKHIPWSDLKGKYEGIEIQPLVTSISPKRITELVEEGVKNDKTYAPPNFFTFFAIYLPSPEKAEEIVNVLSDFKNAVETAYFSPPYDLPAVNVPINPESVHQGYLEAAPKGINAKFAWAAGVDGAGQDFIDFEAGWTLDHLDIGLSRVAPLGPNPIVDAQRDHGTAVLGVVRGLDNQFGIVGIAPNVPSVGVVSFLNYLSPVNGLAEANSALSCGGVFLIEVHTLGAELPIEKWKAEWEWIRNATALGVVVVEAAGNGFSNLDTFTGAEGDRLNRTRSTFRDSGAIMVGAASAGLPHTRLGFSNHGHRIDCYAWGESVTTTWSTNVAPFSTTDFTRTFDGTSSAAAIIAGAVLLIQQFHQQTRGSRLKPPKMRELLSNNGTPVQILNPGEPNRVMPDLKRIITQIQNMAQPFDPAELCN